MTDRWAAGAFTPNMRRRAGHEARQEIARRYRAGETAAEIGADLGISAKTIRRYLLDSGVELRPAARRPKGAS